MRGPALRRAALSLRSRTLLALGIPAGAISVAAACGGEQEVVVAPLAPPVVDSGVDAADADSEGGADGGARRGTRPLREPVAKPDCQRNVMCRPPDTEEQSVPFPDPFAHCAVSFAKDKREATFSPKETRTGRSAASPEVCCYVEYTDCAHRPRIIEGRALRDHGEIMRPTTAARRLARTSARKKPRVPSDDVEAKKLATTWTRAAENEHASIATFARLTLELLALGAPMNLVLGCQRAGLEEVGHAEDAYFLASSYAGESLAALPFAAACVPITPDLVRLARETLVDGCIGESAAALMAERDAERTDDPVVRSVLRRVARDEARHAELAFEILAWTIAEGGLAVRDAIARELATVSRVDDDADEPQALALNTVTAPVVHALLGMP